MKNNFTQRLEYFHISKRTFKPIKLATALCASLFITIFLSLTFPTTTNGQIVTWTLNDVIFTDGGTATGSFDLDYSNYSISNINISIAGGNTAVFPSFTHDDISSTGEIFEAQNVFISASTTPRRDLRLLGEEILPSTGGVVNLLNSSRECWNCSPYRTFTSGYLSGEVIPEPCTSCIDIVDYQNINGMQWIPETSYKYMNLTIPEGNNYNIVEMGANIDASSPAGAFKMAIYNSDNELIYETNEISVTGGVEEYAFTDVAEGILTLQSTHTYRMAFIAQPASGLNVIFKATSDPTNSGIATNLSSSCYSNLSANPIYPNFPNPITYDYVSYRAVDYNLKANPAPELAGVITGSSSNVTTNAFTMNGSILSRGYPDPTAHGFCWNTTGNPTVNDNHNDLGAVTQKGAFSSNLTGLENNTTYYIRSYAINDVGISYGDEVAVITHDPLASIYYITNQDRTHTINLDRVMWIRFEMPDCIDYDLRELGIKVDATSGAGTIKMAIYDGEYSGNTLLYETEEFYVRGGVQEETVFSIPSSTFTLEKGVTYAAAIIGNPESEDIIIEASSSPNNIGVASILSNSSFAITTGNSYPNFPSPMNKDILYYGAISPIVKADTLVNYGSTGTDIISACESHTWINGTTYTQNNNTATHVLQNAVGCDSVVTLNLTINHNVVHNADPVIACDSAEINGSWYYTSQLVSDLFIGATVHGCDSTVNTDLTIHASPTSHAGVDAIICHGELYTTTNASATNHTAVIWTTSGDGTLTNETSLTDCSYLPGTNDIATGSFTLSLEASNDNCNPATSSVTITISDIFDSGAIATTGQYVCENGNPSEIGSLSPATGGDENITYRWQSSADANFSAPVDIAGSNSSNFDPPAGITQDTWYRRLAQDGTCQTSLVESSGAWKVTIGDTTDPVAITQPVTIYLDLNASAQLLPSDIDNGSYDNCNISTWMLDNSLFDCNDVGEHTVTLTVTDQYGNTSSSSNTVTVSDTISPESISLDLVDILCFDSNTGQITINTTGGTAPFTYSIDGGNTFQNSHVFSDLIAGEYHIVVKAQHGCITAYDNNPLVIADPDPIALSLLDVTDGTCYDAANGMIRAIATGGNGFLSYSIDGGNTWQQNSGFFHSLEVGNYNLFIQDENGCLFEYDNNPIILSEPDPVVIDQVTATAISCFEANNGSIEINAYGGTGVLEYSLDDEIWQTEPIFSNLAPGEYEVRVIDEQACLNIYDNIVTISEPDQIVINAVSSSNITCNGAQNGTISVLAMGGSGTLQYSIDLGSTWSDMEDFNNLDAGEYHVWVKDANECIIEWANNPVVITQPEALEISNTIASHISCYGMSDGSIQINSIGGVAPVLYSIDNGSSWNDSPIFEDLSAGLYHVTIKDANECSTTYGSNPIEIIEPEQLTAVVSSSQQTAYVGESVTLNASSNFMDVDWYWPHSSETDSEITVSETEAGVYEYTVEVTNENDCETSASNSVEFILAINNYNIDGENSLTIMPNPNKGIFTIKITEVYAELNLQVYDGKGNVILDKKNLKPVNGIFDQSFNISNRSTVGVYYLRISTDQKTWIEKIIIHN